MGILCSINKKAGEPEGGSVDGQQTSTHVSEYVCSASGGARNQQPKSLFDSLEATHHSCRYVLCSQATYFWMVVFPTEASKDRLEASTKVTIEIGMIVPYK